LVRPSARIAGWGDMDQIVTQIVDWSQRSLQIES
jgi:hypothetical protein